MQRPTPDDLEVDDLAWVVMEAGFQYPMAMTRAAFSETICPIGGELPAGQDVIGRLWDVLMCLKAAIRRSPGRQDRIDFQVSVYRGGRRRSLVRLWAHCGPGDDGEPVITIMLEGED